MNDSIQNEILFFRKVRDSVRFGRLFKHFSEIYQLGFQKLFLTNSVQFKLTMYCFISMIPEPNTRNK